MTSTTKWALFGLLVAFTVSCAILGTGINHPALSNPVFALNALLAVSITAVTVVGKRFCMPGHVFAFGVLVGVSGLTSSTTW